MSLSAGLIEEADALSRVLARIEALPPESVPLRESRGRFAAAEALATQALPGFDNSAMDGYAVNAGAAGLEAGARLRVTGEQAAGADRGLALGAGEAIRIFTGAPMPRGADAVVMQEDVEREGNGEIKLRESVAPGEFVRRRGGDVALGQRLLARGEKLTPARIALLASQGIARVSVGGKARVAILATGDELRAPGQPLEPGEIYESNSALLAAMAEALGARVTVIERARDERPDLAGKLAQGYQEHDALVIAGGVSVGERDLVKPVLAEAGGSLHLWRVRVQPGKPFLHGTIGAAQVFGLPGNPVSAFVTFLLFVRPALLKLMGAAGDELALPSSPATAAALLAHGGDRPHYLRGNVDATGQFTPLARQESHALFGLSRSNALVRLEPGARVAPGELVRAIRL
jgi:molybdopterin molybdotransferase